jgi:preprotein translocase subunit SecG
MFIWAIVIFVVFAIIMFMVVLFESGNGMHDSM